MNRTTRLLAARRPALALSAVATVVLGLAARTLLDGPVSAFLGDALYAVLVYVLVAFVGPRARPVVVAAVAWALCAAVEVAQLVGLSAAVVDAWEPARWVLGTTFHAPDLIVYAVGAATAGTADAALLRWRARRGPGAADDPR
ncbi:DUF2809 domain-containing protein [Sanguibacter suaedae]|uniref:DUF2809 domain-containing protein n=1 Tax=Sanguibacter suaedae TaxID=2795737 RepID=A0A934M8I9_9MICO|nr:DUF2809 domain-containing protein [Sanguibacter suaedae]MBI9113623.1 DUF2809 domain-containing protein [Sanguibacter suaedae]